jgi:uncharacterized protein (UPF0276 family)
MNEALGWMGLGLRSPHVEPFLAQPPTLGFVEVHAENFFMPDGGARAWLHQVRQHHNISLHAVGLGLGSAVGLDTGHLAQLVQLAGETEAVRVSDHACFCRAPVAGQTLPVHGADLLPIAFTQASWHLMAAHVQQVQAALQRPLLIENLSAYIRYADDAWEESDFLSQLCQHTGCQLLVDLNNLVVNALNWSTQGSDPIARESDATRLACAWVDRIQPQHVGQIHLAGHRTPAHGLVIDDHSQCVNDSVWAVYGHALMRWGPRPTLVEWDVDLPTFEVLLAQVQRGAKLLQGHWPFSA